MRILGLEAIDHQFNNFANELKEEIHKLRTGKEYNNKVLTESKLTEITERYTGLKVKYDTEGSFSTRIPDINKNNVLNSSFGKWKHYFQNEQAEYLILKKGMIDGTIDLKQGKVSGDFSEIPLKIYLPPYFMFHKDKQGMGKLLSDDEIVAILLHEIGHNLTFFEMLNRVTTTNFIIADSVRKLLQAETKEQRIVLLAKLEDFYGGISPSEINQIAEKQRSEQAYTVLIMQMAVEQSYSQLNDNIYDVSSCERMADNYVTKFGYSVYLATSLDKLHRLGGVFFRDKVYNSKLVHYSFTLINVLLSSIVNSIIVSPVGVFSIGIFGIYAYIILSWLPLFQNPFAVVYEPIQRRIDKVRLGLIDRLKEPDLIKEEKEELLKDIETIDDITSKMHDNINDVEFIWRYIYLKGRKQYTFIQNQLKLEEMLNNRLFQTNVLLNVHTSNELFNNKKKQPLAIIIKGNEIYIEHKDIKPLATKFYNEVKHILEEKGYKVKFDTSEDYHEQDPNADLYVGHSRGCSTYSYRTTKIKKICLITKSNNGMSPLHYELSDNDIKHLNELPNYTILN